ncbi:MMPL family transporter [Chitinibacter sp. S2-10]|uniref:MMPL family transporter n=1 Tax=Chitinibacter sp. S2-10 TaxID=3373597 RepID=UPI0039775A1A
MFAQLLHRGLPIQTNLMALLPAGETDPVVQTAVKQLESQLGERNVLLIGAVNREVAIAAADRAAQSLTKSGAFSSVALRHNRVDALVSAKAFRYALANPTSIAQLEQGQLGDFLQQQAAQLYGPLGSLRAALLAQDPLFLAGDLLNRRLERGVDFDPASGIILLHGKDKVWALIEARSKSQAFDDSGDNEQAGPAPTAKAIYNAMIAAQSSAKLTKKTEIAALAAGVALHTDQASKTAKDEISRIGIGSWIGSILLMWLVFRRISAIMLCLLPLLVATGVAIVVTAHIMGSIHVLTLVFGASLIGVAIDYGTHCFADSLGADQRWSMSHAVEQLRPALFYGAATSVTGYLALAIAPFPGLREIAVFSSSGLIAAYLTVVLAFPVLLKNYRPNTKGIHFTDLMIKAYEHIPSKKWLCIFIIPIAFGLAKLHANDDLHSFYTVDPRLGQMEQDIKSLFQRAPENQFFLVEGRDAGEVLRREQALLKQLDPLITQGKISAVRALSQQIPDLATQSKTISTLQAALSSPQYPAWLRELGLSEKAIAADASAIAQAKPVSLEQWLSSDLGRGDTLLWLGKTERGYASLVLLSNIKDKAALNAIKLDGVQFVDRVDNLSQLMARYRNLALTLTAASLVVMLLLMAPRHGWQGAALIILPSLLAASGALALFGLIGIALNLFSAFALLIVLALGIDYAIFFRESGEESHQAMLGVTLDSSTTLLSFGLLAMSSLPAAQSFGLMVLFGITLAFVFAPMARRDSQTGVA